MAALGWLQNLALGGGVGATVDDGLDPTNSTAQLEIRSNYEICQRTGFKMLPQHDPLSKMRIEWTGQGVRLMSLDKRHPQDRLGQKQDRQTGPQSAELDDVAVGTVTADNL